MDMKLYKLLFEQQDEDLGDAPERDVRTTDKPRARKSADSVDDQIDSLVLLYEQRAIRDEESKLMESLRNSSLGLLMEQDEEEDAADEEPVEDDTDTSSDPTGSEEVTAKPETSDAVPDLDIDKFTIKIARLIMNYKQLLDVENAIINRAKNFLDENYGDQFVVRYLDILDEQFGIEAKEFDIKYNEDEPFSVGANASGTGGGG